MPSIDLNFLKKIKGDYTSYENFVETGTFMGQTILHVEQYFKKLYTIEIKKEFYERVKSNYSGNKIEFLLGDSSIVLRDLTKKIEGNSIIFLDGHWSAGSTGKGKKDCPLYEEILFINLNHKDEAIIIVDDVRLFGMGPNNKEKYDICNWEDINVEKILKIVSSRMTNHYFLPSELDKDDRLIIHLSKK
jgi:hypothetical protein